MSGGSGVVSPSERAVSALFGYTVGAAVVLPFDRLKSLLQVSDASRQKGAFGLARSIYGTVGIRGLYKGTVPHMCIAPFTVFYYCLYDELLVAGNGGPFDPLLAAICARTIETSIRMPVEVVRTQMQTADASLTLKNCLRLQCQQPYSSWFRGMVPTLMRDVPFSAIYWAAYEESKKRVRIPDSVVEGVGLRTFLQSFVSGASAGMLAAILIAPMDVIKTVRQHQLQAGHTATYGDILRSIYDKPKIAFAGVGPRLVRIPSGLATMMASLEVMRWIFEQRRLEKESIERENAGTTR